MSPRTAIPYSELPLKPDVFTVLLVLLDGERHGYGIMQEATDRSDGAVRLQPGALYRLLKRLLDEGLVEEAGSRHVAKDDDERRRYYRITPFGRQIAGEEARRMAALLRASKAHNLLDDTEIA